MNSEKYKNKIKFLFFMLALLLIWYLGRFFHIDEEFLKAALRKFPLFYAGLLYVILYVIITFFVWFAKDIFWVIGAVLFGAVFSAFLVWLAEAINACILFYLAHYLGRGFTAHYLQGKYSNLDQKIGCLSFSWFFLLRAIPLVPYRFLDLAAGLTCISFRSYLLAVVFGSPLKIYWMQYILAGVGQSVFNHPASLVGYFLSNKTLFTFSLLYLVLMFLVIMKFRIKLKGF